MCFYPDCKTNFPDDTNSERLYCMDCIDSIFSYGTNEYEKQLTYTPPKETLSKINANIEHQSDTYDNLRCFDILCLSNYFHQTNNQHYDYCMNCQEKINLSKSDTLISNHEYQLYPDNVEPNVLPKNDTEKITSIFSTPTDKPLESINTKYVESIFKDYLVNISKTNTDNVLHEKIVSDLNEIEKQAIQKKESNRKLKSLIKKHVRDKLSKSNIIGDSTTGQTNYQHTRIEPFKSLPQILPIIPVPNLRSIGVNQPHTLQNLNSQIQMQKQTIEANESIRINEPVKKHYVPLKPFLSESLTGYFLSDTYVKQPIRQHEFNSNYDTNKMPIQSKRLFQSVYSTSKGLRSSPVSKYSKISDNPPGKTKPNQ